MTIRTFWNLFIKILGIWLVLSFLTVIPQFARIGNKVVGFVLGFSTEVAV